jgi:glycosyltransferase involved in cell wall biosynthesis
MDINKLRFIAKKYSEFLKLVSPRLYSLFVRFCYKLLRFYLKYYSTYRINPNSEHVENNRNVVYPIISSREYHPFVSIIVPNYNHAEYLRERLESIYSQTYDNFEVILLDDCSSDNSKEILLEYAEKYKEKTRYIFNESNSGSVFKQWDLGIKNAKGELIWIAESDDYCDHNFLEEMIKPFYDEMVMLSFSRSYFIKNGIQIWSTDEYLSSDLLWNFNNCFTISSERVIELAFARKNIIPNVSSALFRNIGELPNDVSLECQAMSLCGDWLFYLSIIRGGYIAYIGSTVNYYRIHDKSTSLKVQKEMKYYSEVETVSKYVYRNYKVNLEKFTLVKEDLYNHYSRLFGSLDKQVVDDLYSVERIAATSRNNLNIMLCSFSMIMGGGETYPIFLANALHNLGYSVTFCDMHFDDRDILVRKLLKPAIPCLDYKVNKNILSIINDLKINIVHSHNTMVDEAMSNFKEFSSADFKQVITLHGMYEAIDFENSKRVINDVMKTCNQFIYTTKKNVQVFEKLGIPIDHNFIKMDNGLPMESVEQFDLSTLGISSNAIVFTIISRGIPEKGWSESIEILKKVRNSTDYDIQLIVIGDGPEYGRLKDKVDSFVHFLGKRTDIRRILASSRFLLLLSTFRGESYPLVIIDSLLSGTPVIATNVGEVPRMLTLDNNELAGILIPLDNWSVPFDKVEMEIINCLRDNSLYDRLKDNVLKISSRYDIRVIAKKHIDLYKRLMEE